MRIEINFLTKSGLVLDKLLLNPPFSIHFAKLKRFREPTMGASSTTTKSSWFWYFKN